MKRDFVRNKRVTDDLFHPLNIKIEKRSVRKNTGIAQALINIVVYIFIFVVFFRNNLKFMGLFIAFMVASVVTQFIIRFWSSIRKTKNFPFLKIVRDKKLYENYLREIENEVNEYIDKYEQYLISNLFPASQLNNIISSMSASLYCRLPFHHDFLSINLGKAYIPYPIQINYPNFSYSESDEVLERFRTKMQDKIGNKSTTSLPCAFSLKEKKLFSFVNKELAQDEFMQIINAVILDIVTFQSSEEIVLCMVFNMNTGLEWTRFLPHVWFGNRRLVYCASETEAEFAKLIRETLENNAKHIVAVVDSDFAKGCCFYDIFNREDLPDNLSVIFFSQKGITPSRTKHYVTCSKNEGVSIGNYNRCELLLNTLSEEECENLAKKLFNIKLVDNHATVTDEIPERLTFFELFNVRNAYGISEASYDENVHIQTIFPIKVGLGNECKEIDIDLTNDGDGNHCLVTGTNGSGKSEFMITFILAACMLYSPEYLSFVAIDFKGGAMSSKIRDLPHCRGEFTNNTGNISKREVTRIAELLESEISYRERIMNATDCANDLPKYHRLYAEKKVNIALPRLLIVVDEVAVFFDKDNTAASYITHIATVGRAVGMVLLLATQSKNGVIPSQVRTNINVHVEFYSEDDNKKGVQKIKGRAVIHSLRKQDCRCQVALSSIYDSNMALIDFITLSGKSRMVSGGERYTQFQQVHDEIKRRYPIDKYRECLDEVITEPLELCIDSRLSLSSLQEAYYDDSYNSRQAYPVGISDNIYTRKREPFVFAPSAYNLLVYGRPQSGKTTFLKTLLVSLFHKTYGLRPNGISVYIAAKNPKEYADYCFPHIGNIISEKDLYYLLLFLISMIKERSNRGENTKDYPIVALIDDCYSLIQQSEELSRMLVFVTNESVKFGISIILATSFKVGFGTSALRNFNSIVAFYMGDDFDYSSLMHVDAIKRIPEIPGRCLVNIAGVSNKALETQIVLPFQTNEHEILTIAESYRDLWSGKEMPKSIPMMPDVVSFSVKSNARCVPVGRAKDLSDCYWNLDLANSYLISYFSDNDAVLFVKYLIKVFVLLEFQVIVVDNQRSSLEDIRNIRGITYYGFKAQDKLKKMLATSKKTMGEYKKDTILIIFDYVRFLFPSNIEEKELVKEIDALIQDHSYRFYGVFADHKDFLNSSRNSYTRLGQHLEGVNSGLLVGNVPGNHTFGASGLAVRDQMCPLDVGWGVHVSPSSADIKRIKIAKELNNRE